MTEQLSQKLLELVDRIVEEINKRDIKGNYFKLKSSEVFVPDLSKMHFKDGKVEFFLETTKIQKNVVDFEDKVPEFYAKVCLPLSEFKELINFLQETLEIQKVQAEQIVKNFIYYLIYKTNGDVENKNIDKITKKFVVKLSEKTPYIKTKIYLDGIWLQEEHFQISSNLKIRGIKALDFETHSPEILNQQFQGFGNFPYVVLKYKIPLDFESNSLHEVQVEILKKIRLLIYAFLLFRFGSVFSRKCVIPILQSSNPDIIFQTTTGFGYNSCQVDFNEGIINHLNPHIIINTRHIYVISKRDLENLGIIIDIFERLDIKEILFPEPNNSNYITIALSRYQNAFLNVENLESQISYAVSCLEALFSANPGELQRKLQQRMSKIFSILNFNPIVINDIVRRAYRVRSNYSHGVIEKSEYEELQKLAHKILQCARISLLLFLQIDNDLQNKMNFISLNKALLTIKEKTLKKERKKHFLDLLDNTLIDEKSYQKLKEFIKKKVKIF